MKSPSCGPRRRKNSRTKTSGSKNSRRLGPILVYDRLGWVIRELRIQMRPAIGTEVDEVVLSLELHQQLTQIAVASPTAQPELRRPNHADSGHRHAPQKKRRHQRRNLAESVQHR